MSAPTYNYLKNLIYRITSAHEAQNANFTYYGHRIILQRCKAHTLCVATFECDTDSQTVAVFSFDFWTNKLIVEFAMNSIIVDIIIKTFKNIYEDITIKNHMPL